jgi:hypothetical protein
MISFSCHQCATRFNVADALAGKKARCKKCGTQLLVPKQPLAAAAVAASGIFRMGAVHSEQHQPVAHASPSPAPAKSEAPSSIRLAPISVAELDALAQREKLWEDDDGVAYELEKPAYESAEVFVPKPRKSFGDKLWERGGLLELALVGLRKISDFAYLISVPILLGMLLCIIFKQRELAVAAGAIVILLSLARLALDGFVLFTLAFKNGPLEGLLFFIPPWTFYYLNRRGKVMKEAFSRFLGGAVPVLGVVALAIFVPWLRGSDQQLAEVADPSRLRSELQDVRESIKTRIEPTDDPAK